MSPNVEPYTLIEEDGTLAAHVYYRDVDGGLGQVTDRYVQAPPADPYTVQADPDDPPHLVTPEQTGVRMPGAPGYWLPVLEHPLPEGAVRISRATYDAEVAAAEAEHAAALEQAYADAVSAAVQDYDELIAAGMRPRVARVMLGARAELLPD